MVTLLCTDCISVQICCRRTALHSWTFAAVAFASDEHADPACPSHA